MKEFKYVVQDELGLHARIMAVMSMGVKKGVEVTVTIEGEDEDTAFEAIQKFFQENL